MILVSFYRAELQLGVELMPLQTQVWHLIHHHATSHTHTH